MSVCAARLVTSIYNHSPAIRRQLDMVVTAGWAD